uniref:Uncharacterized protein n=1 Tax=Arundo donax TaxID=35708 RepID=A0A0A9ERG2_ARUDO
MHTVIVRAWHPSRLSCHTVVIPKVSLVSDQSTSHIHGDQA